MFKVGDRVRCLCHWQTGTIDEVKTDYYVRVLWDHYASKWKEGSWIDTCVLEQFGESTVMYEELDKRIAELETELKRLKRNKSEKIAYNTTPRRNSIIVSDHKNYECPTDPTVHIVGVKDDLPSLTLSSGGVVGWNSNQRSQVLSDSYINHRVLTEEQTIEVYKFIVSLVDRQPTVR